MADITTAFFVDNYPAGFSLDRESDSWKDLDASERKHLRNHFAAIKHAVRMVLMHTDSYPLTPDKEAVRKIATAAEERIRNKLDFGNKNHKHLHIRTPSGNEGTLHRKFSRANKTENRRTNI